MEPLKEMFNATFYNHFTKVFSQVYKNFKAREFYSEITAGLDPLSLNERLRKTTLLLNKYLPAGYERSLKILYAAAPKLKTGYTSLVLPDFVAQFGKKDFAISMEALKFFTTFGSSEFAVREFLRADFRKTIKVMEKWAEDEDHHVRRLASEGSRPRLPWSFKLDEVIRDPSATTGILEKLKGDEHIYVKKSVANHLNDISKDNTTYMLQLITKWDISNPNTKWIIRHACRNLIKQGHEASLSLFLFEKDVQVAVTGFKVKNKQLRLGEHLHFGFMLTSKKDKTQKLVVDYVIHYAKASGTNSRKVFKLKEIELPAGKSVPVEKKQLFNDFTTRKHYAGKHSIDILVNGKTMATDHFRLVVP